MAVLGPRFCARAFSSCGEQGPLFIAVRRPLLLRSTGSRRAGSVGVAHGPSRSAACGIFPDQGLNLCPLPWQADSQPLRHQGSPVCLFCPFLESGRQRQKYENLSFKAIPEEGRMRCVRKRENEFQRMRKWKGGLCRSSPNQLSCWDSAL